MRIRQIKPAYWLDKDLQTRPPADVREFYIGLWMLADDAGWLEWDVSRIGAELYPYRSLEDRESFITASAATLAHLDRRHPHLVILRCHHANIPKLTDHQRVGGRPVYTMKDAHARGCARMRADARPGKVGKGKVMVRDGTRETPPLEAAALAVGGFVAEMVGRKP